MDTLEKRIAALEVAVFKLTAERVASSGCGCWYAAKEGVACEHQQAAASEPSSAVPELPPVDDVFFSTASKPSAAWLHREHYDRLRTAAESLRERLGAALRERDEARALAWEQAEHTLNEWEQCRVDCGEALLERDAAITRAEKAERERDALRSQIDQAQRQEPVVWCIECQQPHKWRDKYTVYECKQFMPQVLTGFMRQFPLYAAPVPAADLAQQIAAAEQRGRAQAFEEAAAECGRRDTQAMERGVKWSFYSDVAQWCRAKAEEARG